MSDIIHDKDKHKFYQMIEDQECFLKYRIQSDESYNLYYTFVPPKLRGKMYAVDLIQAAVDFARENDIKITPTCSFVVSAFQRHKDWQDVLIK